MHLAFDKGNINYSISWDNSYHTVNSDERQQALIRSYPHNQPPITCTLIFLIMNKYSLYILNNA